MFVIVPQWIGRIERIESMRPSSDIDTDSNVWAVTPKYLLRKDCVEHQIKNWDPAGFIEFGAGTGNFIRIFLDRGFHGICYDISEANRRTIAANLASYGDLSVADNLDDIHGTRHPYIPAVEVLEHVEDDEQELKLWVSLLSEKGKILLTVPAHQRKFGPDDNQVSHVRRHEKVQLQALLEKCSFANITNLIYGFPLGNLTRTVRNLMLRRETHDIDRVDAMELSERSGRSWPQSILKWSFLFRKSVLWPFLIMRRWTWRLDWGDGYVVTAEKIAHGQS